MPLVRARCPVQQPPDRSLESERRKLLLYHLRASDSRRAMSCRSALPHELPVSCRWSGRSCAVQCGPPTTALSAAGEPMVAVSISIDVPNLADGIRFYG